MNLDRKKSINHKFMGGLTMMRLAIFILYILIHSFAFAREYESIGSTKYMEKFHGTDTIGRNMPTIFALHYMGSKPEDFETLFSHFDFPIRLVFIAGGYKYEDGYSFYPIEYYESMNDLEKAACQNNTVAGLQAFIIEYCKINRIQGKTIITGVSQGGDLSYLLALNFPGLVSLSIPIAASIQIGAISRIDCKTPGTPIYLLHGTADNIVTIFEARETFQYIKSFRRDISLLEFEGKGHEVSKEMRQTYTTLIKKQIME